MYVLFVEKPLSASPVMRGTVYTRLPNAALPSPKRLRIVPPMMCTEPPSEARTVSNVPLPASASSPPFAATSPLTRSAVMMPPPVFCTRPPFAAANDPAKPELKPVSTPAPTDVTVPASAATVPLPASVAAPTSGTSQSPGTSL